MIQLKHTGFEVYRSPEFKAFCERFGIAWSLHTKKMTISLEENSMMVVQQEYLPASVDSDFPTVVETTAQYKQSYGS